MLPLKYITVMHLCFFFIKRKYYLYYSLIVPIPSMKFSGRFNFSKCNIFAIYLGIYCV